MAKKKKRVKSYKLVDDDCVDACGYSTKESKPISEMNTSIPTKLISSIVVLLSLLLFSCQPDRPQMQDYPQNNPVLVQDSAGNVYQQPQQYNQNENSSGLSNTESGLLGAAAGAAAGYYLGNKNNRPNGEYYNDDSRSYNRSNYSSNNYGNSYNNSGRQIQKKTVIINKYYNSKDGTAIKNPQLRPKAALNGFKPTSSNSNNFRSSTNTLSSSRTSTYSYSKMPSSASSWNSSSSRSSGWSSSSRKSGFFSSSRRSGRRH